MSLRLMETVITLDVGAEEPWPNDVLLFQPYPIEQILLPDNANCLATQAFLHMCGLEFKVEHRSNAEFMSPSGKVPFIKCGAFIVSELEPIVQFVGNKGITLTPDLSREEKADLRAYMSLIFSVLMNAELYICWCDKKTYNEVTKIRNGSVYPWPLNHFQNYSKRNAVIRKLKTLGWYQKTLGSVYQEVENCCHALSERLEGREYFFGSKPSVLDAVIFGYFFTILQNPKDFCELNKITKKYENLVNLCKRVCSNYVGLQMYKIELENMQNEIILELDETETVEKKMDADNKETETEPYYELEEIRVCKSDNSKDLKSSSASILYSEDFETISSSETNNTSYLRISQTISNFQIFKQSERLKLKSFNQRYKEPSTELYYFNYSLSNISNSNTHESNKSNISSTSFNSMGYISPESSEENSNSNIRSIRKMYRHVRLLNPVTTYSSDSLMPDSKFNSISLNSILGNNDY